METQIYYEAWQMDCCGTPFSVGDDVEWSCIKPMQDDSLIGQYEFIYEAHGDANYIVCGKVKHMDAIYYEYHNENNVFTPISYTRKPIEKCEEFIADGYLIQLTDVQITSEKTEFK